MARTKQRCTGKHKMRFNRWGVEDEDEAEQKARLERKRTIEIKIEKEQKKRKQVSDLIKQALDDQEHNRKPDYSNMSPTVQQWIKDDQERRSKTSVNEEMLDTSLLKSLPRDIVFDVIDFIPTYSERSISSNLQSTIKLNAKTSGLSAEEMLKEVPDALNPEKLKERRQFECAMKIDSKFLTYHKMRLICKEYALRMKHKIFSTEHLDLSSFDLEGDLVVMKFISFIKDQQYYHDKNECDNILMYFHFQQIKEVMLVPYSTLMDDDSDKEEIESAGEPSVKLIDEQQPTIDVQQEETAPGSSTVNGTSETTIPEDAVVPAAPLPIVEEEEEEGINLLNLYSAHLDLVPYHQDNLENHRAMYYNSLPIELSTLKIAPALKFADDRLVFNKEKLSPIVGVNTVLKSLKLAGDLRYELSPVVFSSCLGLKKVSLFNSYLTFDDTEDATVFDNLEILEFICPTNDIYDLYESIGHLIKIFPNLTTISIFMEPTGYDSVDDIRQTIDDLTVEENNKRLVFTIDGTHYKDITPTGRARKWPIVNILTTTSATLSSSFFTNIILNCGAISSETIISHFVSDDDDGQMAITRKKEFMDLLFIDGNFPVEANFGGSEHSLLFQYAIYIANEYQNGRLYYGQFTRVDDAIRYGWQVGNAWDEVLKSLNVNDIPKVLLYLRKQYGDDLKFFKYIRAITLDMCTSFNSGQMGLLALMNYLKNEKFNFSDIFSPVRCIVDSGYLVKFNLQQLHIPFLSYPFFTMFFHIPTIMLSFAKEEDLLYQNENGDTMLTATPNSEFSSALADIILKKVPQLGKMSNKQNRNMLHIIASNQNTDVDYYLYCREAYGIDENQLDIVGKRAQDYMALQTQLSGGMLLENQKF